MTGLRALRRSGLMTVVAIGASALLATPAFAATSTLSPTPIASAPTTPAANQTPQKVRQCGNTQYVVGTFNTAGGSGQPSVTRNNVFSFDNTSKLITAWDPNVDGLVNDIAFSPDCSSAYIGGSFTTVGGVAAKNIAKISTTTGALDTAFGHTAPAKVYALAYYNGHLLAGGYFTSINGGAASYLTSLSPTTGKIDGYLNLPISGTYPKDVTHIYSFSPHIVGGRMLVNGVFTSVGGQTRRQVFMLDLGSTSATLDAWYSPVFNETCTASTEQFYAKGIDLSPDGLYAAIGSTGYQGATLCDSVAKFPATSSSVSPIWVNKTGGDSVYAVIFVGNGNVVAGGHFRCLDNPNSLNGCLAGSAVRSGIGEIDGTTGHATSWNPGKTRGHGVNYLTIGSDNVLWITSDTNTSSNTCGGKYHPGICAFTGA